MPNSASLVFDGVNDEAFCAQDAALELWLGFTLEWWAKMPGNYGRSTDGTSIVVIGWSNGDGHYPFAVEYRFGYISLYRAIGFSGAEVLHQLSASVGNDDHAWHHYAVTLEAGGDVRFFRDGAPVGGVAGTMGTLSNPGALSLGNLQLGKRSFGGYFEGRLDNFKVWGPGRSAAAIAAGYNAQLVGNESGLAAYWPMNESPAGALTDLTANANHLTISGAAWDTSDFPTLTDPASGTAHTKTLTETLSLSDSRRAGAGKALSQLLGLTDQRSAAAGRVVAEALALADARRVAFGRSLAEALPLLDARSAAVARALGEALALTDAAVDWTLEGSLARTLTETLTFGESRRAAVGKSAAEELVLADARLAALGKGLAEVLVLEDRRLAAVAKALAEVLGISDQVAGQFVAAVALVVTRERAQGTFRERRQAGFRERRLK
jgi:hypothetical protein